MGLYDKQKVLRTITDCSKLYERNLNHRDFLYIVRDRKSKPFYKEVTYIPTNFLHLMGVVTKLSPIDFYNACLCGKLSQNDFSLRADGASVQKANVSIPLMSIHKRATMFGDSDEIYTDVLFGNVRGCIGFKKSGDSRFYKPNTLLEADITKKAISTYPVLAVYQKASTELLYTSICYKSNILKNIEASSLVWSEEIQALIIDNSSLVLDL